MLDTTVATVVPAAMRARRSFAALRVTNSTVQVGTLGTPYGVDNEEEGLPLFLCRRPVEQLRDVWEDVRHYN
jgi:hypothetical protein